METINKKDVVAFLWYSVVMLIMLLMALYGASTVAVLVVGVVVGFIFFAVAVYRTVEVFSND